VELKEITSFNYSINPLADSEDMISMDDAIVHKMASLIDVHLTRPFLQNYKNGMFFSFPLASLDLGITNRYKIVKSEVQASPIDR